MDTETQRVGLDAAFWLGLGLAIPLSIFANLLTPRFQRSLAARNERYAAERKEAQEEEAKLTQELKASSSKYLGFLHARLAQIMLYVAVMTVAANIPFYIQESIGMSGNLLTLILYSLAIIILAILFVLIFNTVRDLRRVVDAVSEGDE